MKNGARIGGVIREEGKDAGMAGMFSYIGVGAARKDTSR